MQEVMTKNLSEIAVGCSLVAVLTEFVECSNE